MLDGAAASFPFSGSFLRSFKQNVLDERDKDVTLSGSLRSSKWNSLISELQASWSLTDFQELIGHCSFVGF